MGKNKKPLDPLEQFNKNDVSKGGAEYFGGGKRHGRFIAEENVPLWIVFALILLGGLAIFLLLLNK